METLTIINSCIIFFVLIRYAYKNRRIYFETEKTFWCNDKLRIECWWKYKNHPKGYYATMFLSIPLCTNKKRLELESTDKKRSGRFR